MNENDDKSLEEWLKKHSPGYLQEVWEYCEKGMALVDNADSLEAAFNEIEAEGIAAEGLIKVTMKANQSPVSIAIAPELMTKDAEELSALVLAAMDEAYKASWEKSRLIMQSYLKKHGFLLHAYWLEAQTIPIKPITGNSFNFYDFDAQ